MQIDWTRKPLSTRLSETGVEFESSCKDRGDGLGLRLTYEIEGRVMTPGEAEAWLARHLEGYPRTNDNGETVWACCESRIGPTCNHRNES